MERIEAVLFDWGGVLIDDPAPGLMAYCAKALGVSVEDYSTAHNRHGESFQKGQIPKAEFWKRVCDDLNCPTPQVSSLWGQAFGAVYSPRPDVFELAGRLRATGYKTALLSNTEMAAQEFFDERNYDVFDAVTFSCAEGTRKPEREIYEVTARKLEVTPARCVFIDDRQGFIDGAVAAGMQGILYEDFNQVCQSLKQLDVDAR
ncbi:MAG: HAD family phosphatase [Phycisphaerales bacterium]|nr:MAG: HAD family phosphatase [Phycisphaerales bacterium]